MKIIKLLLTLTMLLSITTMLVTACTKSNQENIDSDNSTLGDTESIIGETNVGSFEEFKNCLKDQLSKEVLNNAKELFDKATTLEKEGKVEEASKIWEQLYAMDIFNSSEKENITFDTFKEGFKKDVTKEDLTKAEELFGKATALEKEGKLEEANKIWEQLYAMDIYEMN